MHDTRRGDAYAEKGAPVLVWTYDGAYIIGSKSYWGNPSGLIARNQRAGLENIIYVAFNYRICPSALKDYI